MMRISSKERIAFCAQVEETRGEIFAVSPIALQSWCKRVPNEPIPTDCHSWPQRQSDHLKWETDRMCRDNETPIGGRYTTWRVVLHAQRVVICQQGVSDGSDGVSTLWRSHSARTEYFLLIEEVRLKVSLWNAVATQPSGFYMMQCKE